MSDDTLRQHVIDELEFEPAVHAAEIGVAVEDGVVTLSGHVASFTQKLAAERAVWRVKGVRAVAQEIQVHFPEDKKHGDDEIARRAADILAWDTMLPHDAIRVQVQDGWVTLTGELEWNYQRDIAQNDVRRLGGVKGVVSHLTIRPRTSAADVRASITAALHRHAGVEVDRIAIHIREDGTVCLDGTVGSARERRAIVSAAWRAPGVHAIDDRLRIG